MSRSYKHFYGSQLNGKLFKRQANKKVRRVSLDSLLDRNQYRKVFDIGNEIASESFDHFQKRAKNSSRYSFNKGTGHPYTNKELHFIWYKNFLMK